MLIAMVLKFLTLIKGRQKTVANMEFETLIPLMRNDLTTTERKFESFKFVTILLYETCVSSAPVECEAEDD